MRKIALAGMLVLSLTLATVGSTPKVEAPQYTLDEPGAMRCPPQCP